MDVKSKLLEKLPLEEIKKLNLTCLHLSKPVVYDHKKIYPRDNAISSFYNTKDLLNKDFHKHSSLIIPIAAYEKFK